MGDSYCLVEDLSHVHGNSSRESEVNVDSELRASVSLGRFFSESLDWGKWSSFCQKKYLEEAEKYSTPGSVAQRKAFFEAHYKRAAARKAADSMDSNALLGTDSNNEAERNVSYGSSNLDAKSESEEFCVEKVEVQAIDNEPILGGEKNEPTLEIESSETFGGTENQNELNALELNRSNLSDKKPLEEISVSNQDNIGSTEKKARTPTLKSSAPKLPRPTPSLPKSSSSFHCLKESKSTPISEKDKIESHEGKNSNPRSVHRSVNFTRSRSGSMSPLTDQNLTTMKKNAESKVDISLQAHRSRLMSPLTNQTTATMKKEADSKVLSSLQARQNRSPSVRSSSRLTSSNGELALLSRQREDGRIRSPLEQTPSGRQRDVKTYSVRYSQRPDIQGSGKRTEAASFSLSFKMNERVEKKELQVSCKLEHKVSSQKEVKKVQLQETPEENAESETKKLRQSLCFKARPLPDFYRNIEPLKHGKRKIPSMLTETTPTLGKNNSKAKSDPNSLPPLRRSVISGRSVHIRENNSKKSSSSVSRVPNKQN